MTFRKYARVSSVGFATFEGSLEETDQCGVLRRIVTAKKSQDPQSESTTEATENTPAPRSYYVDGVKKIDIRAILNKVADKYSISANPSDYIFEAIRANTTNVPNENHDSFTKAELLRFDLRIGKPVYRTYENKPHHVNHRTDNPKTARGVILDAHYVDETPALDRCPGCDSITKEASQRDESSIHCKKCGTVVKDEFVEILVAVDQKKDPLFANAVKTGALSAGSMGCNCSSTTCGVCNHVAYSVKEFCEHVKKGNKGTYWAKDSSARGGWRRIEKRAATAELARRKRRFITADFCGVACDDGFEIRKSHEKCNQVEFEEYSRVDEPADRKARQREILKAASKANGLRVAFDEASLELETRALLLRAELMSVEAKMGRVAQLDIDADMDVDALAIMDPESGELQQLPEGMEIVDDHDLSPEQQQHMQHVPGAPNSFDPNSPNLNNPNNPNQSIPGQGPSIQDVTDQIGPGGQSSNSQQWGPEAMGILPKATKESPSYQTKARKENKHMIQSPLTPLAPLSPRPFQASYGDLFADVTSEGNAVIVSNSVGTVMTVSAGHGLPNEASRTEFGRQVLASIQTDGLVDTIRRFEGSLPPRFAQILDAAVNDMEEYHTRPEEPSIHDMENDRRDNAGREHVKGLPKPIEEGGKLDMSNMTREISPSTIGDKIVDREDSGPVPTSSLSSVEEQKTDMRGKQRPHMSVPKSDILEGAATNMKSNAGGSGESMRHASIAAATRPAIPAATPKGIAGQWGNLDKGHRDVSKEPHLNVDSYPNPEGTALQQGHQHKADKADKAELEVVESRYKKINASRIASIQKEADERVAAIEATIADRFIRAMKIVAKREALNLEESPMKAAMFEMLASEQVVGHDTQSGEDLVVGPISADLAQHYVERTFQAASEAEITRLVSRAAELMKADPAYIASAESDLSKQASVVPTMTSKAQLGIEDERELDESNRGSRHAANLRRQASQGNLHLTPSPEVDDGEGFDRQAALSNNIGYAVRLGASKTNQVLDLLSQVRPN